MGIEILDPANLQLLKSGFDLVRSALGVAKDIKDIGNGGEQERLALGKIVEAERALVLGEAQIAQALGYKLCRCTFPPQIMLHVGVHPKRVEDIYRCSRCGLEQPPKEYFQRFDEQDARVRAHNDRMRSEHSWMGN